MSLFLDCIPSGEKHKGGNLTEEFERIVQEWDINREIVGVLTDRAAI